NGFDPGEIFTWRVWQQSTQQEFTIVESYLPVGSVGGLITHTNTYANDGVSSLASIDSCKTQNISINSGWNMISSFIIPDNPDMLAVIDDISSSILLVKNAAGQTAIPAFGINVIGNWNITEGYKV
ncbi:unnamed protein product, partial [marine sediment metagenome]